MAAANVCSMDCRPPKLEWAMSKLKAVAAMGALVY
jgi:hypothetical protein